MTLFMDVHSIDGGVDPADVARAHAADLATQSSRGVGLTRGTGSTARPARSSVWWTLRTLMRRTRCTARRTAWWPTRSTRLASTREHGGGPVPYGRTTAFRASRQEDVTTPVDLRCARVILMSRMVQLLGRPSIHGIPGGYQMRSRKSWAMLAYLLLSERPPTRIRLAGLLFAQADDPTGGAPLESG